MIGLCPAKTCLMSLSNPENKDGGTTRPSSPREKLAEKNS